MKEDSSLTENGPAIAPSMIERIARLICKARGMDPDARADAKFEGADIRPSVEVGDMLEWQCASGWARSILKAMREPTHPMDKAGQEVTARSLFRCSSVWEAMIDAALSEDGTPVDKA